MNTTGMTMPPDDEIRHARSLSRISGERANDRCANFTTMEAIRTRLATLAPITLDIVNESDKHTGHAGARAGGGHYALRIVSAQFAGKNTLARHRMIYSALEELLKRDIHALTILAHKPDEI